MELVGCTADLDRVVAVNGRRYVVGEATGDDNNCLIDTLRQVLKPGGLADSAGYLARVRGDLAAIDFPGVGPFQVRDASHPDSANLLEFLEHSHAVVRRLVQHAACGEVERHGDGVTEEWQPQNMKFICADLDTGRCSVVPGSRPGARHIIFARENRNHFIPLVTMEGDAEGLLPWAAYNPRDAESARGRLAAEAEKERLRRKACEEQEAKRKREEAKAEANKRRKAEDDARRAREEAAKLVAEREVRRKRKLVELDVPFGMDAVLGAGGSWRGDGGEGDDVEAAERRRKQTQSDPSGMSLEGKEGSHAEGERCVPCGMDFIIGDSGGGAAGLDCTGGHGDGNAEVVFGMESVIPDNPWITCDVDDGMDEERRVADEARRERREAQWRAMFNVTVKTNRVRKYEFERLHDVAAAIAGKCLRDHCTLPPDPADPERPFLAIRTGGRLPPVCCAFVGCTWHTGDVAVPPETRRLHQEHPWDYELRRHVSEALKGPYVENVENGNEEGSRTASMLEPLFGAVASNGGIGWRNTFLYKRKLNNGGIDWRNTLMYKKRTE